jgi:hypothetical protein
MAFLSWRIKLLKKSKTWIIPRMEYMKIIETERYYKENQHIVRRKHPPLFARHCPSP